MYKRNVKPIGEFLNSCPPQDDIASTAASANSTIAQAKSVAPSVHGQTETDQPSLSRCLVVGMIWKSRQNGMVYDPDGIAPCLTVGNHGGVEPKIIEYAENEEYSERDR